MSLLDIGQRCFHSACSEVDFLPIVCKCNKSFCRHHISPESHQCSAVPLDPATPRHSSDKLRRCDASNCSRPSLNAFTSTQDVILTCIACKQSFCAVYNVLSIYPIRPPHHHYRHRHPSSHSCTAVQESPPSEKANAARALLSKNFPASTNRKTLSRRVAKAPTDPVKLAQFRKVEFIKMRHRAGPGDLKEGPQSVPLDQRLYLKLKVDGGEENILWFRKTMIAGKVLDSLAIHAKIKSSDQSSLQLNRILENGDREVLPNDKPIGYQLEDGDTVAIIYVRSSSSD